MSSHTPTTDVAVVGASVAGLYAALQLARRGREVTLYERTPELDPSLRTLIVTSKMRDEMEGLGDTAVLNHIDCFVLKAGTAHATVALSRPDLIIERAALIKALGKAAADAGVTLRFGHRFRGLQSAGASISLSFRRGSAETVTTEARTVIGADGAFSTVAKTAGMKLQPTAPLLQALVELPHETRQNVSPVWFRTKETPFFYWLIPDSQSLGALGVIGRNSADLRFHLDRLAKNEGLRVYGYQGARIPLYSGWLPQSRSVGQGQVFLVGDAAGHVKVSTVGGIVTGVRGAVATVEKICGERTGATASLRAEMNLHLMVRRALHRFTDSHFEKLLTELNSSSHEVLARLSRDEMPQLIWRLAIAQPRLLSHAARGLWFRRLTA